MTVSPPETPTRGCRDGTRSHRPHRSIGRPRREPVSRAHDRRRERAGGSRRSMPGRRRSRSRGCSARGGQSLILLGAITRWTQQGAGGVQQQVTGPFTMGTFQNQATGYRLWPSRDHPSSRPSAEARATARTIGSIDTAPGRVPYPRAPGRLRLLVPERQMGRRAHAGCGEIFSSRASGGLNRACRRGRRAACRARALPGATS